MPLLPADYCQLELPIAVQRRLTELVWKSEMWFGDKALGLKEPGADVIHYCQLPKELGFQERAPAENPTHVPCARAVLEDVADIVAHIVLDRYPCSGVQTSACGTLGQRVCELR